MLLTVRRPRGGPTAKLDRMVGDILQPTHLLLILVVALLVLGPKRLPEVGRSLGRGLRDFRTALSFDDHESPDTYVTQPSVDAAVADPPAVSAGLRRAGR